MEQLQSNQTGSQFLEQAGPPADASASIQSSRATAEVQGAMVIAKKFPRDAVAAYARIMAACQRRSLAERAVYTYPRGGTKVEGPSIRLAEVLAQCWGNLDFGVIELDQKRGESTVMAYAWDLETNTRQVKTFQVKHSRKARGEIQDLDDPRDIYEITANQGARRLRACILGIIPGDIVDEAVEQCSLTLQTDDVPLEDRIRKMAAGFKKIGVTVEHLEARVGHKLGACSVHEVVDLGKIYNSINNNMSTREDWFEIEGGKPGPAKKKVATKKVATKKAAAPAKEEPAKEKAAPAPAKKKTAPTRRAMPPTEKPGPTITPRSTSSHPGPPDGDDDNLPGLGVSDDERGQYLADIEVWRESTEIPMNSLLIELEERKLIPEGGAVEDMSGAQAQQVVQIWNDIVDAIENPDLDG